MPQIFSIFVVSLMTADNSSVGCRLRNAAIDKLPCGYLKGHMAPDRAAEFHNSLALRAGAFAGNIGRASKEARRAAEG